MADPDDAGKGEAIGSSETISSVEAETLDATSPHPPRAIRGTRVDYTGLLEVDPHHYEIGDELARGGMGRILSARDRRLGRRVAIKELIRHDGEAEARFEREARITARLQHPSIVHLHEAGRWPSGEPFYAMKLVAGKPLDYKIYASMNLDERLALLPNVIAVVDALAYAHSEGVIHRDLKPSNVLCGEFGETVVIDWGLAKDLHADTPDDLPIGPYREPARSDGTVDGAVIGTPAYMPPEQADGEKVDARADVYALGAMLYHVLAGVPPYHGKTTAEILTKVLSAAPAPLLERDPEIPIDLVAIVDKAMARKREDRFPTAKEMVDELKRFQTGQLVTSHRYTAWELLRRWIDRHRAAVAVGAVAVAAVTVLGIVSISEIVAQRDRADEQATLAQTRADAGTMIQASALLARDPHAALEALRQLGPSADWSAVRMIAADAESRGFGRKIATGTGGIVHLAVSRDGAQLAAASETGVVTVWDVASRSLRSLAHHDAPITSLAFAGDGAMIAIDSEGAITRRAPGSSTDAIVRRLGFLPTSARIAPDGKTVAVFQHIAFEPDRARLFDVAGGERDIGAYYSGEWSADGRLVLYDRHAGQLVRFDPANGGLGAPVDAIALTSFTTDGERVFIGTFDGDVTEGGVKLATEHHGPIRHLVVLPKRGIATASSLAILHTLDVARRRPSPRDDGLYAGDFALTISAPTPSWVTKLVGHDSTIGAVAASADGSVLVSGDHDGTLRLWQLPRILRTARERTVRVTPRGSIPQGKTASAAFLTPDHHTLVLARRGPALEVRDLATGRVENVGITDYNEGVEVSSTGESVVTELIGDTPVEEFRAGAAYAVTAVAHSGDGRRVATLDDHHAASLFDLAAGRGRVLAEHVSQIAISPDGKRVATVAGKTLTLWDAATGRGSVVPVDIEASALAFSPDSATLAAASPSGAILLVGATARVLPGAEDLLHVLAFSPDGKQLAGGGERWRVRLWNVADGTSSELVGHNGTVTQLAYAPGGRIVSASADGTVRVWDGGNALVLRGHTGLITALDVRSDGRMVVTASADRTARIWDAATGHSRALPAHEDSVVFAGYTDDAHVVTVDHGGTVTEFPDDLPADRLGLAAWLAAAVR